MPTSFFEAKSTVIPSLADKIASIQQTEIPTDQKLANDTLRQEENNLSGHLSLIPAYNFDNITPRDLFNDEHDEQVLNE